MNAYSIEEDSVLFSWGIVLKDQAKGTETITNASEIEIQRESFKFIFKPWVNVFVYLYHYTLDDELSLLFPRNSRFFDGGYETGEWYDIPQGHPVWFPISNKNTGLGKYYLLVSKTRLKKLESLTAKLVKSNDTGKNDTKTQKEILDEIKSLINQQTISTGEIEKPVPIAGTFKTGETENVYEVRGVSFYARVFSIKPKKTD
jgi:hypothetical protein